MFYARYHPRDFSNEYEYRAFPSAAARDEFVKNVPEYAYSEYYQAMVPVGSESARAYPCTYAEVAADTRRERAEGYRADGTWGREKLTVAEYLADSGG